jgi:hypothetical protein
MGCFAHPIFPHGGGRPSQLSHGATPKGQKKKKNWATPKDPQGPATPKAIGPNANQIFWGLALGGGWTTSWGPRVTSATPKWVFGGGWTTPWGPRGWPSHPLGQTQIFIFYFFGLGGGRLATPMGENGVAKPPHIFLKFNFFFVNKFYIYFLKYK